MALKRFLMIGFVAAVLVACGDDDSDFISRPDGKESSSSDVSSSSDSPQSSDGETSVSAPCSALPGGICDYGSLTDSRDDQTYKTITIGTQTWMAENLNYAYTDVFYKYDKNNTSDSTSWCYDNVSDNCTKYGRLYTWAAAMDSVGTWGTNGKGCGYDVICSPTYPVRGICPEGWHLPSKAEFEILFEAVGGVQDKEYDYKWQGVSTPLKSITDWNSSGNGTDAFGFSSLPAGGRGSGEFYHSEGNFASFWSSTEYNDINAYNMSLHYDDDLAYLGSGNQFLGFSVRCVKD